MDKNDMLVSFKDKLDVSYNNIANSFFFADKERKYYAYILGVSSRYYVRFCDTIHKFMRTSSSRNFSYALEIVKEFFEKRGIL